MAEAPRVLLVEDQEVIRRMLTALLEARGFQVEGVTDGPTAVERVSQSGYAAVVLDLVLPGPYDGIEVCRRLRALPQHARTPVVVVSGRHDADVRARVLAAGADRYFLKPVSAVGLLRAIEALTRR